MRKIFFESLIIKYQRLFVGRFHNFIDLFTIFRQLLCHINVFQKKSYEKNSKPFAFNKNFFKTLMKNCRIIKILLKRENCNSFRFLQSLNHASNEIRQAFSKKSIKLIQRIYIGSSKFFQNKITKF